MQQPIQKTLDYLFEIGVSLKGINGVLESVGGFIFLFFSTARIDRFIIWLASSEIAEDPNDLIANWLITSAHQLSVNTKVFIGLYLLTHGLVKVVLVIALLKNKLWSYPASIIFLLIFIVYQIERLISHFSIGFFGLTIFDLFIIFLIWQEYYKLKNKLRKN